MALWLQLAHTATLWLTLALSGSLLFYNFAYTVLGRLSGPLFGSQRRCHADTLYPSLLGGLLKCLRKNDLVMTIHLQTPSCPFLLLS